MGGAASLFECRKQELQVYLPTGRDHKQRILERMAEETEVSSTYWRFVALDVSSRCNSSKPHRVPKKVKLASTRRYKDHESLWTSCCNRGMRSAAKRTAFHL